MNNDLEQLKTEVQKLQDWKRSLERSSSIPLPVDQSFRERFLTGKMLWGFANVDFANCVAGNSTTVNVTVSGARKNDPVLVCPQALQETARIFQGYVASDGIVTIKFDNQSGSDINLGATDVLVVVFQRDRQ